MENQRKFEELIDKSIRETDGQTLYKVSVSVDNPDVHWRTKRTCHYVMSSCDLCKLDALFVKDGTMVKLLWRRIKGGIQRLLAFGGYGACGRCGRSWMFLSAKERHITKYSENSGCFPLCEDCWSELTPVERLSFYRSLWEKWNYPGKVEWSIIERAIRAGR